MASDTNIGFGRVINVTATDWKQNSSGISKVLVNKWWVDSSERLSIHSIRLQCESMAFTPSNNTKTVIFEQDTTGYTPKNTSNYTMFANVNGSSQLMVTINCVNRPDICIMYITDVNSRSITVPALIIDMIQVFII